MLNGFTVLQDETHSVSESQANSLINENPDWVLVGGSAKAEETQASEQTTAPEDQSTLQLVPAPVKPVKTGRKTTGKSRKK